MMMKIFAIALLALALTACESSTENANSSNENKPSAATPAAATPAATAAPASPVASMQIKAGDKVKVTTNGASTEATVVSVDEKAGKVTVKMQGQKEEKTVPISAVTKQ